MPVNRSEDWGQMILQTDHLHWNFFHLLFSPNHLLKPYLPTNGATRIILLKLLSGHARGPFHCFRITFSRRDKIFGNADATDRNEGIRTKDQLMIDRKQRFAS